MCRRLTICGEWCKITPMASELTTIKTSLDALKMLRVVAALTGEKQYEVIERLLKAELEKIEKRGAK